jgi:hypothetical protein
MVENGFREEEQDRDIKVNKEPLQSLKATDLNEKEDLKRVEAEKERYIKYYKSIFE